MTKDLGLVNFLKTHFWGNILNLMCGLTLFYSTCVYFDGFQVRGKGSFTKLKVFHVVVSVTRVV